MTNPFAFRTPEEWLPWLETLSPREIVLGLERVQEVLARLDIRRPELVITVAGTNGKGSCVALLDALLSNDGRHTGVYTSPHLSRYNERICVGGRAATDEAVVDALRAVETCRGDVPLTYFEFGTAAALAAFSAAQAEVWILEVGMGGRLDAVNAVDPDASLIASVGLDHCAWLGDDREKIGFEKAGIMRGGKVTVFGGTDIPRSVAAHADAVGADLRIAGRDFSFERQGGNWSWQGRDGQLAGLPPPPIPGPAQYGNAAAVFALIEAIGLRHLLQNRFVGEAFAKVALPGRCQIVESSRRWILDVAHNPDAADHLAATLSALPANGGMTFVVGMLADKDVESFASRIAAHAARWIATATGSSRGSNAATTAARIANATGRPCLICEELAGAMEAALEASQDGDSIVVAGSFFLVGPALDWLRRKGHLR